MVVSWVPGWSAGTWRTGRKVLPRRLNSPKCVPRLPTSVRRCGAVAEACTLPIIQILVEPCAALSSARGMSCAMERSAVSCVPLLRGMFAAVSRRAETRASAPWPATTRRSGSISRSHLALTGCRRSTRMFVLEQRICFETHLFQTNRARHRAPITSLLILFLRRSQPRFSPRRSRRRPVWRVST